MIIKFSYQNHRLFYGLKKNGKHYFIENGTHIPTKYLKIQNNPNSRYESRNIFISKNNTNDNKEYLFSISTNSSGQQIVTELHDLNRNIFQTKDTTQFIGERMYSYSFSLYAINNTTQYLISYITTTSAFIKIFSFSNFSLDNIFVNSIQETKVDYTSRIINSFQMNDNIILLYLYGTSILINIYDLNLQLIADKIKINNA